MVCLWQLSYGAVHSVFDQIALSTPSPPLAWIFSSHLSFCGSWKMEKLLQSVELESWAWWMSSECAWIPWGVAREGGWPNWRHLMEPFISEMSVLVQIGMEWKAATAAIKIVFGVGTHHPQFLAVWSPLPTSPVLLGYIRCSLGR